MASRRVASWFLILFALSSSAFEDSPVDKCFSEGTVRDFVQCWSQFIGDEGSMTESDYQSTLPTKKEIEAWKEIAGIMVLINSGGDNLPGHCQSMTYDLKAYNLRPFIDKDKNPYCILYETALKADNKSFAKGWGLVVAQQYAFDKRTPVLYSAAHPISDGPVHLQAAEIYARTSGLGLVITGTRRDASKVDSTCQPGNFRTDAAHNDGSMFHIALAESIRVYSESTGLSPGQNLAFLQFHGKANTSCSADSVFLSTGYSSVDQSVYTDQNLQVNRLKSAWLRNAPAQWTVRTPADDSKCSLTATTNVAGRLLNGVKAKDVCGTKATPSAMTGVFIHAEQSMEVRETAAYDAWAKSIMDAFPNITSTTPRPPSTRTTSAGGDRGTTKAPTEAAGSTTSTGGPNGSQRAKIIGVIPILFCSILTVRQLLLQGAY